MRVVVVVADPDPISFTHAITSTVLAALGDRAHQVAVLDLCAESFQAAMSRDEWRAYHNERPILDPMVERHAQVVKQAEALIFIYPTASSTMPAILKGWLERVMVPGVGFVFDEKQHVRPGLTNVRRIVVISTYGHSWPYVKAMHDNGRRTLLRALRLNTALATRRSRVGLYKFGTCTSQQRAAFLRRVGRKARSL
jgi:NAD(P)H dehydrogenase (quinone)